MTERKKLIYLEMLQENWPSSPPPKNMINFLKHYTISSSEEHCLKSGFDFFVKSVSSKYYEAISIAN